MKGYIYIDSDLIGEANFKVIDESMGVIGGDMLPSVLYDHYKKQIQDLYENKGIANIDDLNFKIILENETQLDPEGGIGITHSPEFKVIYIDAAGLDVKTISMIKG